MSATSTTVELPHRAESDGEAERIEGGTKIGRYVVLDKVGQGGMGVVYTAYDPELDRKIALKLLRVQAARDGQARLLREAQAMAKIAHPNTVGIYDVGLYGGRVFLAMELVIGVTLRDWLAVYKRSWREVVDVMIEAGRGLAAAHEAGLAHRDFKPDNVLIGPDGRPKVTDYGLARRAVPTEELERIEATDPERTAGFAARLSAPQLVSDPDDAITHVGAVLGTPAYMAPEQRRGRSPDVRTDQYSFAVTLYEALFGKRPAYYDTVVEDPNAPPRTVTMPATPHVPRWLAAVVKRALSEKPEDRYPSMTALLADLSRDRSVKVRRALLVATIPAIVIAGIAIARLAGDKPSATCDGAAARLRGAWDETIKAQIASSFLATKSPFAADAWERTASLLDSYSRNWVAMRREACEATRVRGEQPATVMSMRMMCLDRAEAQLRALTSVLATSDPSTVERATQAASALPRLSECADVQVLARDHSVGGPFEPKLASATSRVARVNALYETGRYADGLIEAAALDKELGTDMPRIAAENAYLQGQMLFARGQLDESIAALERSSVAAERGAYPLYVARAYGRLACWLACAKRDLTAAARYDQHAQAVMHAIGGDALAETWRLTGLACIRDAANDPDGSSDAMSRAVATYSKAYGRDALYATLLSTFGSSLGREPARALRVIDDAIATQESLLGNHHPKLAFTLTIRAQQLTYLGRYDESADTMKRAIAIREQTVTGPDRLLASAYLTYARVLWARGDLEEASKYAQRGIDVRMATAGKDGMETIAANVVMSTIAIDRGQNVVAQLEADLGRLVAGARDKPDLDLTIIDGRVALGTAYRNARRTADAIAVLDQALAGAQTRKDPRLVATAQFALAQAHVADPGAHTRARSLAEDALRGFTALPNAARASDVQRWLDAHPAAE